MRAHSLDTLLRQNPMFAGLPDDDLALLAGCARNCAFRPGERMFSAGEPADRFYVIRDGRVAIEVFAPGGGPLVLETAQESDVVDGSWLFPPYRWQFDGTAITSTRALSLDGACLRGHCDVDPRLGYALMTRFAALASRRLVAARVRLADLYGHARH